MSDDVRAKENVEAPWRTPHAETEGFRASLARPHRAMTDNWCPAEGDVV